MRVPVVLDLVIRPARQFRRDHRPSVAERGVERDDERVLVAGEGAPLEVGPEVVDPPQAAALAAPVRQPRQPRQRPPAAFPVGAHVGRQPVVFLPRPGPLRRVRLLAARGPPHGWM